MKYKLDPQPVRLSENGWPRELTFGPNEYTPTAEEIRRMAGSIISDVRKAAIEWIESGGWAGWVEDQLTGKIFTSEGDVFRNAIELKNYLSALPAWPRLRDGQRAIPKKGNLDGTTAEQGR